MAKIVIGAFFASLLFFIQSAAAIEIDGSDDPEFKEAVEAWLMDDDRNSLPILSKLATEGNTAARYLLGQIERMTHFASETPYTRTLDRKQRIALFRSPGGLAGTSWVSVLKDDNEELATILISLKDPRYEKEQLAALIRMGEDHIAMRELIREISFGRYGTIIELDHQLPLRNGNRAYLWYSKLVGSKMSKPESKAMFREFSDDFTQSGVDSALMTRLTFEYLTPKTDKLKQMELYGDFLNYPGSVYRSRKITSSDVTGFQKWLKSKAPTTENLTLPYIFCRKECPYSVRQCMMGVLTMAGGYEELRTFQSPLENLIPHNTYLVSERAKASLFRRMKWATTQWDDNKQYDISTCLENTLNKN